MKRWLVIGLVVILVPNVLLALLSIFSKRPANLGVANGHLAPCPDTPNCVCSEATDGEHAIAPFKYEGTREEAIERMKKVIAAMPRAKVVTEMNDYLHAEFTSRIFRFVDDVEMYFDDATKTIQVRSAARAGKSDFGVNRARMEEIRKAFAAAPTPSQ
jgi:uncharacterized protein (DUF1499 family)